MKVSTFGRHKASASLSRISTRSPVVAVAHRTRAMQQQHQSVHQERQHSHHLASTSSPTHGTTPTPHVPDTLPSAVTMFAAHPTSVVITTGIVCVCALRLQGPALGVWDALTVAAVAAFWVLQEWAIHKYLLHAPFQWVGSKIHIDHHQQPYHHVSIDSLTIVVPWMIGAAGVLHVALHGGALSLSATAAYFTMGLCYEWVHFLVHTRYVPRCVAMWGGCACFINHAHQVGTGPRSAQQPHEASFAPRALLACFHGARC